MQKVTAYKTNDNKFFDTFEDAEEHEYLLTLKHNDTTLTERENEIFNLLVSTSLGVKELAELLHITQRTIKAHCSRIYSAKGVKNRLNLVLNHYLTPSL
jgi:DNA-binding NarL/FixJ family response regulator